MVVGEDLDVAVDVDVDVVVDVDMEVVMVDMADDGGGCGGVLERILQLTINVFSTGRCNNFDNIWTGNDVGEEVEIVATVAMQWFNGCRALLQRSKNSRIPLYCNQIRPRTVFHNGLLSSYWHHPRHSLFGHVIFWSYMLCGPAQKEVTCCG